MKNFFSFINEANSFNTDNGNPFNAGDIVYTKSGRIKGVIASDYVSKSSNGLSVYVDYLEPGSYKGGKSMKLHLISELVASSEKNIEGKELVKNFKPGDLIKIKATGNVGEIIEHDLGKNRIQYKIVQGENITRLDNFVSAFGIELVDAKKMADAKLAELKANKDLNKFFKISMNWECEFTLEKADDKKPGRFWVRIQTFGKRLSEYEAYKTATNFAPQSNKEYSVSDSYYFDTNASKPTSWKELKEKFSESESNSEVSGRIYRYLDLK
ncbi:hypothetical protein MA9V2_205 [Chryseobacterium phage MA9V-2]|nr:hypothetical protein MA9V2_205 [Chryseobacterium phage MA9V-2]